MGTKFPGNASLIPVWKRILDLSLIILALPILLPLMAIITLGILVVSPGPVFFRQQRIGLLGRRFTCWKFRSMRVNANVQIHENYLKQLMQSDVPMTKMDAKGDPRLIPLGSLLRSSGLDELPQLFNVLRGDMSIVGPRPCTPSEYENYEPWQMERFKTLPGLTGWWQVNGKNKTTFNQMISMDISYVDQRSFAMDLRIIFKTIPVLLGQIKEIASKKPKAKQ